MAAVHPPTVRRTRVGPSSLTWQRKIATGAGRQSLGKSVNIPLGNRTPANDCNRRGSRGHGPV
jgi:hypothetical protein